MGRAEVVGGWRGNTQEIDHVLSITAVARGRGQQDGGWVKGGGMGKGQITCQGAMTVCGLSDAQVPINFAKKGFANRLRQGRGESNTSKPALTVKQCARPGVLNTAQRLL